MVLILMLTTVVALLEGINIGLVLPLLETLESPDAGGGHFITEAVANLFAWLGVPFKLATMLVVLVLLITGMSILKYFRMLWEAKTATRFTVWTRDRTVRNFMHTDLSYFHQEKLGMLTQTYVAQTQGAGASLTQIINIFSNLAVVVTYLVAAFLISPSLTAVALGMLVIVTAAVQYNISKAKRIGAFMVKKSIEVNTGVVEGLSGIHVVKSFMLERLLRTDMEKKSEEFGDAFYREQKNISQTMVIQEMSVFAMLGGIAAVGVLVLSLDFALIIALLFVLFRLAPKVNGLNIGRQSLAVSLASLHHVRTTMDETSVPSITSGETPFSELHQGIELKDVNFSYNNGVPVLRETHFTIEKGKVTAIAGTSGAGKTTLVDLLLRHYDPSQGEILVDGVDLKELDLASWRGAIGVVSQDVFLFHDTVAYNISLGRPGVTEEDIKRAAKQAYAHNFVEQLPQGYDTPIGDRGWNLSGGERQRVSLARAILMKPEILILDEATSSLDLESERLIQDSLEEIKATCTLVVVAHRLSTVRDADRIIVMQDGKVVEQGDWDSLLRQDGVFARYQQLQSASN